MTDVTDATFEQEVLERSRTLPVVIDLWAEWCGPCKTLGPILERAVEATDGAVELVKVDVDQNPQIARAFQVQSIPAVFAMVEGKVVDGFIGALPESQVVEFISRVAPPPSEADVLVGAGDEASLRRALELEPGHVGGVTSLARLLVERGEPMEAIELLQRIPETADVRTLAAEARLAAQHVDLESNETTDLLDSLLDRVREDDAARQEYVDLLETLGPEDPRTLRYRKALAAKLF